MGLLVQLLFISKSNLKVYYGLINSNSIHNLYKPQKLIMIIILAALLLFQVGCIDSLDISPEELKSTNLEQKSIQVGSNDM